MSRILFISDLHANSKALDAVLDNVEYDEVFCPGDLEAVCRKIGAKMPHAAELEGILRRGY
jgi:Icc-related predicted phosphoesterase